MIDVFHYTIPLPPMSRLEPLVMYLPPKGQKSQWLAMVKALEQVWREAGKDKGLSQQAKKWVAEALHNTPESLQKGYTRHYIPPDREKYQNQIKMLLKAAWRGDLIDYPVFLEARFYRQPPKKYLTKPKLPLLNVSIWPGEKPDFSNLVKLIEDCLEGTVLHNDSLIVGYYKSRKLFAVPPSEPRTELALWKI